MIVINEAIQQQKVLLTLNMLKRTIVCGELVRHST